MIQASKCSSRWLNLFLHCTCISCKKIIWKEVAYSLQYIPDFRSFLTFVKMSRSVTYVVHVIVYGVTCSHTQPINIKAGVLIVLWDLYTLYPSTGKGGGKGHRATSRSFHLLNSVFFVDFASFQVLPIFFLNISMYVPLAIYFWPSPLSDSRVDFNLLLLKSYTVVIFFKVCSIHFHSWSDLNF